MGGQSLDQAGPAVEGFACPWCPVVVSGAGPMALPGRALLEFERHLDAHHATGRAA